MLIYPFYRIERDENTGASEFSKNVTSAYQDSSEGTVVSIEKGNHPNLDGDLLEC